MTNSHELTPRRARKILAQMGEHGTPPELGISHVNVGNESYLHILEQTYIVDRICENDGSAFKLVQGTYGAGKTHFLLCVRDLAWRRNLLTALVTISPKECQLNKPLGVYRAVARQIELPPSSDDADAIRGIDDILRHRAEEKAAELGREQAHRWVQATLARAPLAHHTLRDAAVKLFSAVIDGQEETARHLGAWLRGEVLPPAIARAAGLFEAPSNENGFALLRSLVQLVSRIGFAGTVLLLDEAERRLSVGGRRTKAQTETVDHLRELVDLCGRSELPRALVLYAVTPAFTQEILPEYPALQQRLGSPVQYLSPHNPKAPLIDLEALDLAPVHLLTELGHRLARVARVGHAWSPDRRAVTRALDQLVHTVTTLQLEVSHRRLFVKLWVRLLDEMRLGGTRAISPDEMEALVRDEQVHLLEEDLSAAATFFGQPVAASLPLAPPRPSVGTDPTLAAPPRRPARAASASD